LAVVETSPPRSLGSNDGRDRLMPMTYIIDREVDLSTTGVLRMHATMEESEHQPAFHIFRDIASAEAWLDI
jgi:hypothetical protein